MNLKKQGYNTVSNCRISNSKNINNIINFGEQPLANSFKEKKNILEIQNKSFLRIKWEKILKSIIVKRIPKVFIDNKEIAFINNEEQSWMKPPN